MSYSPPNTFVNGTTLTAADMEGNFEALRLYLHEGIAVGDMAAVQWVDSRHIQPARYNAFTGVQHGVTGHQGVQWSGGAVVNLTFATKFLTGQGAQTGAARWHRIPNTAFSLDIRRPARTIFHWHAEIEVGPDASPEGDQADIGDRHVWLSPYRQVTNDLESSVSAYDLQMVSQNDAASPWASADAFTPTGTPTNPYTTTARYGQRTGVMVFDQTSVGTITYGVCAYSRVGRSGVLNWSAAIEIYYL